MFDTNLSLKNRIYLSIRNFSIPTRIDIKKTTNSPDMILRKYLFSKSLKSNFISKELLEMVFLNMPTDFIENFSFIGGFFDQIKFSGKAKNNINIIWFIIIFI